MKIRELLGEGYLAEDGMSLRDWFGKGKHGGAGGGGWDRYNTKGERVGKCGDRKRGEGKPKCLSKAKAASLRASGGKKAIAAAVRKKKSKDKNPERQGKAKMVSNKVKREDINEGWSKPKFNKDTVVYRGPKAKGISMFSAGYHPDVKVAWIESIKSDEPGAGKEMIGSFQEWAKDQGAKAINAEALPSSIGFWKKLGFSISGKPNTKNRIPIQKTISVSEAWSEKYKRSINCNNPKGFSQRAHCAGRKKNESVMEEDVGKPVVYLDMDGVLADFNGRYKEIFGKDSDANSANDPNVGKLVGTDFFATLDKLPDADKLVAVCVYLFGGYSICSSPLRGDGENSAVNKKLWIKQHLTPQPDQIVITGKKDSYAKGKNILIDDRPKNINAWRDRGGIGILYNAYTDSLDTVIGKLQKIANTLDK